MSVSKASKDVVIIRGNDISAFIKRMKTPEYAMRAGFKFLLNISFFFGILILYTFFIDITQDYMLYFIFVFIDYVISGILSFVFSYIIVKLIFLLNDKPVIEFTRLINVRRRYSKLWITVFTLLFKSIFFILSALYVLGSLLPINNYVLSLIVAWIILDILSKLLGWLLRFLFKVM